MYSLSKCCSRKEHLNRHYELVHKNATLTRKQSVKNTAELSERKKRRKAKELNNNLLNEQDAEIKKFVFKEIIKDDVVKEVLEKLLKQDQINEQDVIEIVKSTNLTDNQVNRILRIVRKRCGRRIITP